MDWLATMDVTPADASSHEASVLEAAPVTPPDPETAWAQVRTWMDRSATFAELINRHEVAASALRHFGLLCWSQRRLDEAAQALLCALTIAEPSAALWGDLAGVYEGSGEGRKAEFCIRTAIDLDPTQSRSWLLLANLAKQRADIETARDSYRRAIALEPRLENAHFGLGIINFEEQRFAAALVNFQTVVDVEPSHALGHTCLGHVLYATGCFQEAASAFDAALRLGPLDTASHRKHARARTFETMIAGRIEPALDDYPGIAGEHAEALDVISRDAFAVLSAYGYREAAVAVGRLRIAERPEDPIQQYLLDAVTGQPHTAAPAAYVEAYFDRFAKEFDHKLVEVLRYDVPRQLKALVSRHCDVLHDMLDLGCGTGLACDHLVPLGERLTGVDLSSGMLEEARKRSRYVKLVQADAISFLQDHERGLDLVFAADLLVYIGNLEPLFEAAKDSIRAGGFFALSIETADDSDFVLLSSGRFAHAPAYVERLALVAFERVDHLDTMIRLEAGRPVDGRLYVFRRR